MTERQFAIISLALRYLISNIDHSLEYANDDPIIGKISSDELEDEACEILKMTNGG